MVLSDEQYHIVGIIFDIIFEDCRGDPEASSIAWIKWINYLESLGLTHDDWLETLEYHLGNNED